MTPVATAPQSTCAGCRRVLAEHERVEHRGALYCVSCVGRALDHAYPHRGPSYQRPLVAVLLSLMPGAGQMYNRQPLKGILVMAGFFVVATADFPQGGLWNGVKAAAIVTLYFWNFFDAYWTAQRMAGAEPPAVPEAIEEQWQVPASAPGWGILLIVVGVLFLLYNFGVSWVTPDVIWPAGVLCLGIWLLTGFVLSQRSRPPAEADSQEEHHD
jgi:TM2 domain-containing membrane protein YozV